jgi:DNA-binding response OmpR family regulator
MAKKVLLIEDDLFLTDIYLTKFEQAGYEVDVASDGKTGMEKLRQTKPDILLLDLVIPGMDGFVLLEQLKKDDNLKNISVLVLSNRGSDQDVQRVKALGADDYLIKSQYTPSEVVAKAQELLR